MARTDNSAAPVSADAAAKPKRKPQRAADKKLYLILAEGTDPAAFKASIQTVTSNGKIVLDNMEAGTPRPFVILKLATASRGASGEAEETATVE